MYDNDPKIKGTNISANELVENVRDAIIENYVKNPKKRRKRKSHKILDSIISLDYNNTNKYGGEILLGTSDNRKILVAPGNYGEHPEDSIVDFKLDIAKDPDSLYKKLFWTLKQSNNSDVKIPFREFNVDNDIKIPSNSQDYYNENYKYTLGELQNAILASASKQNSVVLYQGNIFINGKCYSSYTGHLENMAKIAFLQKEIEELKEEIKNLKDNTVKVHEDSSWKDISICKVGNGNSDDKTIYVYDN